jgi:sortase A
MKINKYALLLLLLGVAFCAHASWMPAKAWLAEKLIQHSWHYFQQTGQVLKPWPWADTHAIASLKFIRLQKEVIVLDGGDPSTLAFSAGAIAPFNKTFSYLPFVVAGHRDSHFSFLPAVRMHDIISLADESGEIKLYQVDSIEIIDSQTQQINSSAKNIAPNTNTTAELILITCYPFNALSAGGSLRYVIKARPLK